MDKSIKVNRATAIQKSEFIHIYGDGRSLVYFAQKFWEFEGKICATFFEKNIDKEVVLWYNWARVRDTAPTIVKFLTACRYKKNRRHRLLTVKLW